MLPASYGNPGPRYRATIPLSAGPRRVVDDNERVRFYVAPVGKHHQRTTRRSPPDLRRCENILVVNLDFIGDWILKTPFLRNLRHNAPRARISALVLERVFELASACPFVDRVIALARADHRRVVFGAARVTAVAGFRRDFLGGRFDLAIVPRWDADFNGGLQIAYCSQAPHVVGFSERSTPRKKHLNRGDDRFYTHPIVDRRHMHEADRDLGLIVAMGGRLVPAETQVDFGAGEASAANRFLEDAFGVGDIPFIAVAPFGSQARRTLPADTLAAVVLRLATRFDLAVVVVAGPEERSAAGDFADSMNGLAVSAAGALPIRQSAALVARAAAFVGMDSGPAHLAAAAGTPTAVLFCHPATGSPGHTAAPERFAPRGAPGQVAIIRPDVATAPCVDGCVSDEAHCIRALTEEALWPRLSDFVGAALKDRAGRRASRRSSGTDLVGRQGQFLERSIQQ